MRALARLGPLSLCLIATLASAADPEFGSIWHDGKAEIDGYRLSVHRYGEPRVGQAALIYVTEPFRLSTRVKADDPSQNPSDAVDVLKLNLVRDFQTGIYDYNTMTSLFVRSDTFVPLKLSFSSAEWCGHVYEELLFDAGRIRHQLESYFENESTSSTLERPAGGMLEDELFIALRGLRGDFSKPGAKRSVPFLPSAFYRRLAHKPATWSTATIERLAPVEQVRVPAGTIAAAVYVVRVADGREGRFFIERAYPHRIVKWTWTPPKGVDPKHWLGGTDSAELAGTQRVEYWKLNANGDERWLDKLGIAPTVGK